MLAPTLTEMRLRGIDYTLPSAQGSVNTVLTNNGSGVLTWSSAGGLSSDVDFNTKGGTNAGLNLVSGAQYNTFLGYEAGKSGYSFNANEADYNTSVGYRSLYSNTTGSQNTANGSNSLYSNINGWYNTANGSNSLYSNTAGINNTANGYKSLYSNTSGHSNTANGSNSLYSNTTGSQNTANGFQSLFSNINNWANTANGFQSLYYNTGSSNTANGTQSLYSNTTGSYNTANGYNSLYSNTTGSQNTVNGSNSLFSNTSGHSNTANGSNSLYSNTTGSYNTANGFQSLFSNTTGSYNTALGYRSGMYYGYYGDNQTSNNSLYLGYDTRASANGNTNEIVIGASTIGNGSNTTTIGTGNVLYVGGSSISGKVARFTNSAGYCDVDPLNASLVCSSDITLKKNITTLEDIEYILNEQIDIPSSNLEKLLTLTPVKYNWNSEADDISKHTGFIAQEVEQLFPELVSTDENTELKSISYSGFTPYIVEAIKELNLKVEAISLDDNDSNIFSSIIKKVENGIAYLTGLVVDTIVVGSQEKRTGITLYDEETGDPYCITIVNGEMINREGECGVVEMPDICPNIDEYQQEIPEEYELDENNECIEKQDLEIPVDPSSLSTATPSQE